MKYKDNVKYVTMDMCREFKKAVKDSLKNATIVADKFHYTMLICWGFENVRKKVQKNSLKKIEYSLNIVKMFFLKIVQN